MTDKMVKTRKRTRSVSEVATSDRDVTRYGNPKEQKSPKSSFFKSSKIKRSKMFPASLVLYGSEFDFPPEPSPPFQTHTAAAIHKLVTEYNTANEKTVVKNSNARVLHTLRSRLQTMIGNVASIKLNVQTCIELVHGALREECGTVFFGGKTPTFSAKKTIINDTELSKMAQSFTVQKKSETSFLYNGSSITPNHPQLLKLLIAIVLDAGDNAILHLPRVLLGSVGYLLFGVIFTNLGRTSDDLSFAVQEVSLSPLPNVIQNEAFMNVTSTVLNTVVRCLWQRRMSVVWDNNETETETENSQRLLKWKQLILALLPMLLSDSAPLRQLVANACEFPLKVVASEEIEPYLVTLFHIITTVIGSLDKKRERCTKLATSFLSSLLYNVSRGTLVGNLHRNAASMFSAALRVSMRSSTPIGVDHSFSLSYIPTAAAVALKKLCYSQKLASSDVDLLFNCICQEIDFAQKRNKEQNFEKTSIHPSAYICFVFITQVLDSAPRAMNMTESMFFNRLLRLALEIRDSIQSGSQTDGKILRKCIESQHLCAYYCMEIVKLYPKVDPCYDASDIFQKLLQETLSDVFVTANGIRSVTSATRFWMNTTGESFDYGILPVLLESLTDAIKRNFYALEMETHDIVSSSRDMIPCIVDLLAALCPCIIDSRETLIIGEDKAEPSKWSLKCDKVTTMKRKKSSCIVRNGDSTKIAINFDLYNWLVNLKVNQGAFSRVLNALSKSDVPDERTFISNYFKVIGWISVSDIEKLEDSTRLMNEWVQYVLENKWHVDHADIVFTDNCIANLWYVVTSSFNGDECRVVRPVLTGETGSQSYTMADLALTALEDILQLVTERIHMDDASEQVNTSDRFLFSPEMLKVIVRATSSTYWKSEARFDVVKKFLRHPHPDMRYNALLLSQKLVDHPAIRLCTDAEKLDPLLVETSRLKISALHNLREVVRTNIDSLESDCVIEIVTSHLLGLMFCKYTPLSEHCVFILQLLCHTFPVALGVLHEHLISCMLHDQDSTKCTATRHEYKDTIGLPAPFRSILSQKVCSDPVSVFRALWKMVTGLLVSLCSKYSASQKHIKKVASRTVLEGSTTALSVSSENDELSKLHLQPRKKLGDATHQFIVTLWHWLLKETKLDCEEAWRSSLLPPSYLQSSESEDHDSGERYLRSINWSVSSTFRNASDETLLVLLELWSKSSLIDLVGTTEGVVPKLEPDDVRTILQKIFLCFLKHPSSNIQISCIEGLKNLLIEPFSTMGPSLSELCLNLGFHRTKFRSHKIKRLQLEGIDCAADICFLMAVLIIASRTLLYNLDRNPNTLHLFRFVGKFDTATIKSVVVLPLLSHGIIEDTNVHAASRRASRTVFLLRSMVRNLRHLMSDCVLDMIHYLASCILQDAHKPRTTVLSNITPSEYTKTCQEGVFLLFEILDVFSPSVNSAIFPRSDVQRILKTTFNLKLSRPVFEELMKSWIKCGALNYLLLEFPEILDRALFLDSFPQECATDASLFDFRKSLLLKESKLCEARLKYLLDNLDIICTSRSAMGAKESNLNDASACCSYSNTFPTLVIQPRLPKLLLLFESILRHSEISKQLFSATLRTCTMCINEVFSLMAEEKTCAEPTLHDFAFLGRGSSLILTFLFSHCKEICGKKFKTADCSSLRSTIQLIRSLVRFSDPKEFPAMRSNLSSLLFSIRSDSMRVDITHALDVISDSKITIGINRIVRALLANSIDAQDRQVSRPNQLARNHAWEYLLLFYKNCYKFDKRLPHNTTEEDVEFGTERFSDIHLPSILPEGKENEALVHFILSFLFFAENTDSHTYASAVLESLITSYSLLENHLTRLQFNEGILTPVIMPKIQILLGHSQPWARKAALGLLGVVARSSFGVHRYEGLREMYSSQDSKNVYVLLQSPNVSENSKGLVLLHEKLEYGLSHSKIGIKDAALYFVPHLVKLLQLLGLGGKCFAMETSEGIDKKTYRRQQRRTLTSLVLKNLLVIAKHCPPRLYLRIFNRILQLLKKYPSHNLASNMVMRLIKIFPAEKSKFVETYLVTKIIPFLQCAIEGETLQAVQINALLHAYSLIPFTDYVNSEIRKLLGFLVTHLRTKSKETIRDRVREILTHVLQSFGFASYFPFVLSQSRAILSDGYQVHVLGYTIIDILIRCKDVIHSAKCARNVIREKREEITAILLDSYFGKVGEEKTIRKLRTLKESKKNRSLEGMTFLAEIGNPEMEFEIMLSTVRWLLSPDANHKSFLKNEKRTTADRVSVNKARQMALAIIGGLILNVESDFDILLKLALQVLETNYSALEHISRKFDKDRGFGSALQVNQSESKVQRATYSKHFENTFSLQLPAERRDVDFVSTPILDLSRQRKQKLRKTTMTNEGILTHQIRDVSNEAALLLSKQIWRKRNVQYGCVQTFSEKDNASHVSFHSESDSTAPKDIRTTQELDVLSNNFVSVFLPLLMNVLRHDASDETVKAVLLLLQEIFQHRSPFSEEHVERLFEGILGILDRGGSIRTNCFRVLSLLMKPVFCKPELTTVSVIVSTIHADVVHKRNVSSALSLLKVIMVRRWNVIEVVDIMPKILETMIQTADGGVRNRCLAIIAIFFTDYLPLDHIQSYMDILLSHAKCPTDDARFGVLRLMYVLMKRCPLQVLSEHAHVIMSVLAHSLASDGTSKCRKQAAAALSCILEDGESLTLVKSIILSWLQDCDQEVQYTGVSVSKLLFQNISHRASEQIANIEEYFKSSGLNSLCATCGQHIIQILEVQINLNYSGIIFPDNEQETLMKKKQSPNTNLLTCLMDALISYVRITSFLQESRPAFAKSWKGFQLACHVSCGILHSEGDVRMMTFSLLGAIIEVFSRLSLSPIVSLVGDNDGVSSDPFSLTNSKLEQILQCGAQNMVRLTSRSNEMPHALNVHYFDLEHGNDAVNRCINFFVMITELTRAIEVSERTQSLVLTYLRRAVSPLFPKKYAQMKSNSALNQEQISTQHLPRLLAYCIILHQIAPIVIHSKQSALNKAHCSTELCRAAGFLSRIARMKESLGSGIIRKAISAHETIRTLPLPTMRERTEHCGSEASVLGEQITQQHSALRKITLRRVPKKCRKRSLFFRRK